MEIKELIINLTQFLALTMIIIVSTDKILKAIKDKK